jgi:LysM repeat protein
LAPCAETARAQLQITILPGVTVTSEIHSESTEGSLVRERRPALPAAALATQRLCPYLVADGFGWRSASASRDHCCGAVAPPVPLSVEKQRRLCLVNRHVSCPTYVAAAQPSGRPVEPPGDGVVASYAASPPPTTTRQPGGEAITRWSIVRTVPVLLDQRDLPGAAMSAMRTAGGRQAALVGILAIAFMVIVGPRLAGGSPPTQLAASPRPTSVVAAADATPVPSTPPSEAPAAATPPAATAVASAQPTPLATLPATPATRTYIVKRGDTLYEIARRFRTTVATIQQLNGMGSSTMLHAGDVLKLPQANG